MCSFIAIPRSCNGPATPSAEMQGEEPYFSDRVRGTQEERCPDVTTRGGADSGGTPTQARGCCAGARKNGATDFIGEGGADRAESWIKEMDQLFARLEYEDIDRVRAIRFFLKLEVAEWWESFLRLRDQGTPLSWAEVQAEFHSQYCPPSYAAEKRVRYHMMIQGTLTVDQYEWELTALRWYVFQFFP